jgi:hypothetical protein
MAWDEHIERANISKVFHLAAAIDGQSKADFHLGLRANLDASVALLDWALNPLTACTVDSFPGIVETLNARRHYLQADANFDALLCRHMRESLAAPQLLIAESSI